MGLMFFMQSLRPLVSEGEEEPPEDEILWGNTEILMGNEDITFND
jgi:hypothetical protein